MRQSDQTSRSTRRALWYIGAGLALVLGISFAIFLPHHCFTGYCPVGACIGGCSGLSLFPRVGIALAGLAVASVLVLVGRRASN
jgi:hypothetical protein